MGLRIERIEERLQALSGALRLRGVWRATVPVQPQPQSAAASQAVLRLRGAWRGEE